MGRSDFPIEGASILVVGASGGLGGPLSRALAGHGARLTLAGRDEARLAAVGVEGAARVTGDLRDPAVPAELVAAAVQAHGRLDGVVNAAGIVAFGPLEELSDGTLDALLAVNVAGPVRLVRAALPHLRRAAAEPRAGQEQGQAFVLSLSGAVVEAPTAGMAAYAASKGAVAAFDAALARELRSARVRVVDARPPHTETGLSARPLAGHAPNLPRGLEPQAVAARLVRAVAAGERDVPSSAFV